MTKKSNRRRGKIVTGGHSAMIEGLRKFLEQLESWDEITIIRVGRLSKTGSVGRTYNTPSRMRNIERHYGGGGGFQFRATRLAKIGRVITGIKCYGSNGTANQEVYLISSDYPALKARLIAEGYLGSTE